MEKIVHVGPYTSEMSLARFPRTEDAPKLEFGAFSGRYLGNDYFKIPTYTHFFDVESEGVEVKLSTSGTTRWV